MNEVDDATDCLPSPLVYWSLLGVTVAAALAAIWLPPWIPGQDTPHHTFFAFVGAHPERFEGLYEFRGAWTGIGFNYPMIPFVDLGLPIAQKLVRTLGLGLFCGSFYLLGRVRGEVRVDSVPPSLPEVCFRALCLC